MKVTLYENIPVVRSNKLKIILQIPCAFCLYLILL